MPQKHLKILYTTDLHLRDTTPSCRTEAFFEGQFIKLQELVSIVGKEEIDLWVNGGDMFDTYNPSYEVLNRFIGVLRAIGKPMYTICGSHDLIGYNLGLVNRTAVGPFGKSCKYCAKSVYQAVLSTSAGGDTRLPLKRVGSGISIS